MLVLCTFLLGPSDISEIKHNFFFSLLPPSLNEIFRDEVFFLRRAEAAVAVKISDILSPSRRLKMPSALPFYNFFRHSVDGLFHSLRGFLKKLLITPPPHINPDLLSDPG